MDTITDHLRQHLLDNLGVIDAKRLPDLDTLRREQWSPHFEELRSNRMVLGAFRYGLINEQGSAGSPYDNIGSLIQRAQAYQETGDREHLVDIANLAMIEFTIGQHPLAHFNAKDDGMHTAKLP